MTATKLPAARVFVMGDRAHGTSEVIEALRALHEQRPPRATDRGPPAVTPVPGTVQLVNDFGPTLGAPKRYELASQKRRYALWECVDGVESLVYTLCRQVDGVVWVLSARDPLPVRALDMLDAASFFGARGVTVFLNDCGDADERALDQLEAEARDALDAADFPADEIPFVRSTGAVSARTEAWREGISQLSAALDEQVPYVSLDRSSAIFLVDDVFSIKSRGTVAAGSVVRGAVRVGDTLRLITPRGNRDVLIDGVEIFRRALDVVSAPATAAFLMRQIARDEIARDDVLAADEANVSYVTEIEGDAYVWTRPGASVDARDTAPLQIGDAEAVVANGRVRATIVSLSRVGIRSGRCAVSLRLRQAIPWYDGASLLLRGAQNVVAVVRAESAR